MARIRTFFHGLSLVVGGLLVAVVGLALLAFAVRWVQITWFYSPAAEERAAEKAAYLASLAEVAPRETPNLVVVFFDDLGWGDLSSYGNQLIATPRIDALGEAGIRMTDFYSASPVCTPSRAALLTGRFPIRSGTHRHVFFTDASPIATMRKVLGWGNEIHRDEILLPEALRAAGYATGMIGKWHLGGHDGFLPNDLGFDSWFGVLWSNDMTPLHVYRDGAIEEADTRAQNWMASFRDADTDDGSGIDQRQLTRRYTDEAIAFIDAKRDEPFFLYVAHSFPHVPHFSSPEQEGRSEGGLYGDVVEDLDTSTGRIVDALAERGLLENTLFLVTSDNGADYNGSPGFLRGRKGETYEGGQRVPFIAHWPGRIAPGQVSDALAMNTDLFPTLLGLVGLPLPDDRQIDGRDLGATWLRGAPSPHELLYYVTAFGGDVESVRDARFKYRKESGDTGRSKPQLWRMDADVEAHDLTTRFPDDAKRLAAALDAQQDAFDANPRGWK